MQSTTSDALLQKGLKAVKLFLSTQLGMAIDSEDNEYTKQQALAQLKNVQSLAQLKQFAATMNSSFSSIIEAAQKEYPAYFDLKPSQVPFNQAFAQTQSQIVTTRGQDKPLALGDAVNVMKLLKPNLGADDKIKLAKSLYRKTKPSRRYISGTFDDFLQSGSLGPEFTKTLQGYYDKMSPTIKQILNTFIRYRVNERNEAKGKPILSKSSNPLTINSPNYRQYRIAKQFIRQIKNTKSLLNSKIGSISDEYIAAKQRVNQYARLGNPLIIAGKIAGRVQKYGNDASYESIKQNITDKLAQSFTAINQRVSQKFDESSLAVSSFSKDKVEADEEIKQFLRD